jgi:formate dehydrogenase major subunit
MIHLTINGKECAVPKGTLLLDACRQMGIDIPTLCHLGELSPDGSCRMCVVEQVGGRKGGLPIACGTYCAEGMVIETHSEKVLEARKFVLDLLLSNHVTDCFNCASNGRCKLQAYCLEYGISKSSFGGAKSQPPKLVDDSNPFFDYQPDLCVMCRRCARTCEQIQGRDVISVSKRGFHTVMKPSGNKLWIDSHCESCGNCVQSCPTGALSYKANKRYREFELTRTTTTCPHCAVGCQMELLTKKGKLVAAAGVNGPSNNGQLCVKGRFGSYSFVDAGDRVRTPLIKRNGSFEQASWDEALDLVASRFKAMQKEHGNDCVAGFSCSRATNEDNYMFQKMMRTAFHTNNVDNCARV